MRLRTPRDLIRFGTESCHGYHLSSNRPGSRDASPVFLCFSCQSLDLNAIEKEMVFILRSQARRLTMRLHSDVIGDRLHFKCGSQCEGVMFDTIVFGFFRGDGDSCDRDI